MLLIYDCEQVAKKIGVSKMTVLRWVKSGKICASVIHKREKSSVSYFLDSDISALVNKERNINLDDLNL